MSNLCFQRVSGNRINVTLHPIFSRKVTINPRLDEIFYVTIL